MNEGLWAPSPRLGSGVLGSVKPRPGSALPRLGVVLVRDVVSWPESRLPAGWLLAGAGPPSDSPELDTRGPGPGLAPPSSPPGPDIGRIGPLGPIGPMFISSGPGPGLPGPPIGPPLGPIMPPGPAMGPPGPTMPGPIGLLPIMGPLGPGPMPGAGPLAPMPGPIGGPGKGWLLSFGLLGEGPIMCGAIILFIWPCCMFFIMFGYLADTF